jgi:calcineurin-like phosphoesterase family protein
MKHEMIKRHNELVESNDICYFLGDVYFGDNWKDLQTILNRMNGKKHLILGNHDWMYVFNYVEAGFISVHTALELNGIVLIHDPAAACDKTRNFIHGHLHTIGLQIAPNCYNVSMEMHNYYPVELNKIIEVFNENLRID